VTEQTDPEECRKRRAELDARRREFERRDFVSHRFHAAVLCPNVEKALYEVAARLTDEAFTRLYEAPISIVYGGASEPIKLLHIIQTGNEEFGKSGGKGFYEYEDWVLVLAGDLEEAPHEEVVGTIAHELAHIALDHDGLSDPETAEFDANGLAIRWGFGKQIMSIVRAEERRRVSGGPSWEDCLRRVDELRALAAEAEQGK
jgi:hypothetical protein